MIEFKIIVHRSLIFVTLSDGAHIISLRTFKLDFLMLLKILWMDYNISEWVQHLFIFYICLVILSYHILFYVHFKKSNLYFWNITQKIKRMSQKIVARSQIYVRLHIFQTLFLSFFNSEHLKQYEIIKQEKRMKQKIYHFYQLNS